MYLHPERTREAARLPGKLLFLHAVASAPQGMLKGAFAPAAAAGAAAATAAAARVALSPPWIVSPSIKYENWFSFPFGRREAVPAISAPCMCTHEMGRVAAAPAAVHAAAAVAERRQLDSRNSSSSSSRYRVSSVCPWL